MSRLNRSPLRRPPSEPGRLQISPPESLIKEEPRDAPQTTLVTATSPRLTPQLL